MALGQMWRDLPVEMVTAEPLVQLPASTPGSVTSKIDVPITRGAPLWLTGKNILIGTGIGLFAYIAYGILKPRKKVPSAVSGFGWLWGKRRRRRR